MQYVCTYRKKWLPLQVEKTKRGELNDIEQSMVIV